MGGGLIRKNYLQICLGYLPLRASLGAQTVKNLPALQETQVQSLGQGNPLEKGMATLYIYMCTKIATALGELWGKKRGISSGHSVMGLPHLKC